MYTYMITYDLTAQGKNYEKVIETIKSCSIAWYSAWKSSYLIKSNMDIRQIMDKITQYLDGTDTFFIVEVSGNYNGRLKETDWDIIKEKIFT